MAISRRRFIRVVGGTSVVIAASAVGLSRCDPMPGAAIAAWDGPGPQEQDPRRRALAYAILAPNPHNMQPWLADLREPDAVTLFVDQTRLLPATDPYARQIMIGYGAFLELMVLAAATEGYRTDIGYFPKGVLPNDRITEQPVAHIRFHRDGQIAADPLVKQILRRRSAKQPYDPDQTLRNDHADALAKAHPPSAVTLRLTAEAGLVEQLRQITDQAMTVEMTTPRTLWESIERLRIGADEIAQNPDGINLHGPLFWWAKRLALFTRAKAATPGTFAYQAGLDYAKGSLSSAVAFGWMTTADNGRQAQLDAGRAYVRFNLKATELGVAMQPLSQVLQEYPEMQAVQRRFLELTGTPAGHTVQMLFRLGYAERPEPAPRRPLNAFLLS